MNDIARLRQVQRDKRRHLGDLLLTAQSAGFDMLTLLQNAGVPVGTARLCMATIGRRLALSGVTAIPARPSLVYFAKAGDSGAVKIGTTNDIDSRFKALQCGNAAELQLLATVPGDSSLEHTIHKQLSAHRLRGEWFRDGADLRQLIHELQNSRSSLEVK